MKPVKHRQTPNLEGQVFGRLTVIKFAGWKLQKSGKNRAQWLCRCECGNEKTIVTGSLKSGKSKSCGCLCKDIAKTKIEDLTGKIFGRLTVIGFGGYKKLKNGSKRTQWLCKCSCGSTKTIAALQLKNGSYISCGHCNPIKVGDKFGKLIIKKFAGFKFSKTDGKRPQWLCECECGNERKYLEKYIKSKAATSCGCNKYRKGEDSPSWNSNITDEEREIGRNTFEKRIWVKAVYERDHYTCQKCGQVSGNLEAHHIENWADNPELRYDLDNGIILCEKCHRVGLNSFHRIYGNRNTTKEQMKEFLSK